MSKVVLEVDDKKLMSWIKKITQKVKDPTTVFQSIASEMERDVFDHFDTDKKGSSGKPWPAVKKYPGKGSILVRGGDLRRSITKSWSNKQAQVATNLIYAATHNFGDSSRNIPRREFMYISDTASKRIEKAVMNELMD